MKKDIFIYYLFSFLLGFYIANGTTVLFERELGFSYQQVFVLAAFYMLMFIIFEVPSGAMADLLGRKKTMALGCFVLAVGAVASGLSENFWQLFLSFFLWAFGFSCISGADEALIYDRLKDEKEYTRVWGRAHFFFLIAMALAGILGPMLYAENFRYPYLFSAIPFFVAGIVIQFFSKEEVKGTFTLREHINQIKTGAKFAFHNKYILWAMGVLALTFAVWYNLSNSYQPFLVGVGFTIRDFSWILPAIFVSEAAGGFFAGKFIERLGERKIFVFGFLLFGLSVGLAGHLGLKLSVVFLLAYSFLLGILRTTISTYANRHIESSHRATVISFQGMMATISAALSLFLFGFLTDRIGLANLFILLGALTVVGGILLLIFRPKEEQPLP
ncbi:MAG: MFS transporter [Candidatus Taylorbacteria bacterium]|nr:MFS transporter [Candidatus Taylorbacteria bacterium]